MHGVPGSRRLIFRYDYSVPRKLPPPKKHRVSNDRLSVLRRRIASAPQSPGVYRWLDENGKVLYVGKAKNLRNRLRSYVTKDSAAGPWKQSFLQKIADFEVTVTNTEIEALIFETNQIKELRPKYNVLMKDDKNYIYVRITREEFPRVDTVRKIEEKDNALHFGPFLSAGELEAKLAMLRSVFPFRTCRMGIALRGGKEHSEGNIDGDSVLPLDVECHHKDRPTPCLDHHIGKCVAPCVGAISPQAYREQCIDGVIRFLKGDCESIRPLLEERMKKAAADRKFELASQFRDSLASLDRLQGKQLATDTSGEDMDIIAVSVLSMRADVVVMQRRNGRLIGDTFYSLAGSANDGGEVLEQFLPQYYEDGQEIPDAVVVSDDIDDGDVIGKWLTKKKGRNVELVLPQRGKRSHLLQLAEKNVREKARQRELKWESERKNTEDALQQLQNILALPASPRRIEGYDISHLGGTETVGSMTVMKEGRTANDQYRSFTLRSLKKGEVDDYKSLKEVLRRRLRHLAEAVKEEERFWKSEGVTFGHARKEELKELKVKAKQAKEFLLARREKERIAQCRLERLPSGLFLLSSFSVSPKERGAHLGQFLLRKILRTVKKGKVYIICKPELEEYYAEVGFRHVRKAPVALRRKVKPGQEVFMREAALNKIDPSLAARPDLLVIDGGKGQLGAALEVLKAMDIAIPVIGLAKREEEVFVAGKAVPVIFPSDSSAKFLLMRLRDEAHRFANRHRESRGVKAAKESALDGIPGIGAEARKKLFRKFGSAAGVRESADAQLREVLSEEQVREVRKHL